MKMANGTASGGAGPAKKARKSRKSRKGAARGPVCHPSELASDERQRQQGGVISEFIPVGANSRVMVKRHRAAVECQLDIYLRRGNIDDAEHMAGMKMREAWQFSAQHIKTSDLALSAKTPNGGSDRGISLSRSRVVMQQGIAALTGVQQKVVMRVCCHDEVAGNSDAIKTLKRGLERLSRLSPWPDMKRAGDDHAARVTSYSQKSA
ncbi:MAG TPA: hypothetical protein VHB73_08140 [Alphaproteobacteria bacterium]|nr:hypothetical protein [Alphaproteobacteria bacterium]